MKPALRAGGGPSALLGLLVIAALPGWEMHRVYTGDRALPLAVGAAVVAAALSWLVKVRFGQRLIVGIAVSVVGFCVYGIEAVGASTTTGGLPTGRTLSTFGTGVVHGVADLLSTTVPADPDPTLLLPLAALSWAAAAFAFEIALRRRWVAAPLLPGVVATGLATSLAVGVEAPATVVGVVFVVAAAAVLAGRWRAHGAAPASVTSEGVGLGAEDPTRGPRLARVTRATGTGWVAAVPVLAVVAVIGAGVGSTLTFGRDRHPVDPRSAEAVPANSLRTISPLDEVTSELHHGKQVLFTVATRSPSDMALASFDQFDGFDWSSSGRYIVTGAEVPATGDGTTRTGAPAPASVDQQVRIAALSGPWLPAASRPSRVSGAWFRVNLDDGALLARTGHARGAVYTVTSSVAEPDSTALEEATVPTGAAARADEALPPGAPPALIEAAQVATAGATNPLTKALLLERYLRGNEKTDPKAPAGHSYGRLVQFLTVQRVGTSEQFATAFAVMARLVGLPSRIVVGFGPGQPAGPGRYQVTGSDALVWPEVDFAGIGWVPFDPTPTNGAGNSLPLGGSRSNQANFVVSSGSHPAVVNPPATPPPAPQPSTPVAKARPGSPIWPVILGVGLVLLLVLAGLAAVLRRRAVRRRRRRDPSPRRRIVGAWAATRERLTELNGPLPPSATVTDVLALGEATHAEAGRALAGLYRAVNQALFDPNEPTEADAERAWKAYDTFAHHAGRGPWRRRTGLHRVSRGRPRPSRQKRPTLPPSAKREQRRRHEPA